MKRVVYYALTSILFLCACSRTPEEVKQKIKELEQQEQRARNSVSMLKAEAEQIRSQIDEDKLKVFIQEGGKVRYILKVKLKQERGFDMDYEKAMKDYLNEVEFNMYVDRMYYNEVEVGDKILEKARKGSQHVEGSSSNWVIQVVSKSIKKIEL